MTEKTLSIGLVTFRFQLHLAESFFRVPTVGSLSGMEVLLYDGEGSSQQSVEMAFHTFGALLQHSPHTLQKVSPDFLLKGEVVSCLV